MGTQNEFFKKFSMAGILIHTFPLELWPCKVFPYVCIGKPFATHALRERARLLVTTFTDYYKIAVWMPMGVCKGFLMLSDGFFFYLVGALS